MIELAWLLMAGSGVLVSLYALYDAQKSVESIHNRYNGRRVVARGYRRSEAITTAKQLTLLALGVPASLDPEPVRLSWFVVALFILNVLSTVRTLLELRDRIALRRMLEPQEGEA